MSLSTSACTTTTTADRHSGLRAWHPLQAYPRVKLLGLVRKSQLLVFTDAEAGSAEYEGVAAAAKSYKSRMMTVVVTSEFDPVLGAFGLKTSE